MKHLWKSLMLTAGVIALGGTAMAADVVRPPPAPAPIIVVPQVYNWAGPYIGIQGGWDSIEEENSGFSDSGTGGIFGIFGGVNLALANAWIFGIDASINWTSAEATGTVPTTYTAGPDWKGFIRGRLGIALNRLLLYGTLGGAVMNYNVACCGGNTNATPWGWTAGLGADWGLTDNLFLRIDWAYQDYGSFTLNGSGGSAGTTTTSTANTVTAGLGWKF